MFLRAGTKIRKGSTPPSRWDVWFGDAGAMSAFRAIRVVGWRRLSRPKVAPKRLSRSAPESGHDPIRPKAALSAFGQDWTVRNVRFGAA